MSTSKDRIVRWQGFSEEHWQLIVKALGVASDDALRQKLRIVTGQFIKRRNEHHFNPVNARAAMKSIAALSGKLRKKLEECDRRAWHPPPLTGIVPWPRDIFEKHYWALDQLIKELRWTEERAAEQVRHIKKKVGPADLAKEIFWTHAAEMYEQHTSTPARASVGAPGTSSEGKVGGPFVRFMRALTSDLPNEKKPTDGQIRAFVRRYQVYKRSVSKNSGAPRPSEQSAGHTDNK